MLLRTLFNALKLTSLVVALGMLLPTQRAQAQAVPGTCPASFTTRLSAASTASRARA